MMFQNGDMYIGEHFKGKMHGNGQYKWANGSIYIGMFKNGLKHGKGNIQSLIHREIEAGAFSGRS